MNVQTGTREGLSTSLGTFLKAIVVAVMLLAVVPPAFATFPGSNGRIAYSGVSGPGTSTAYTAIFLTDLGQLTFAPGGFTDFAEIYPAWSPDGSQLAFVRREPTTFQRYTIEIIRRDGTGERTLIGSEVFDRTGQNTFSFPAWSADGKAISFIRDDRVFPPPFGTNRIYTINTDGTNLTEVIGPEIGPDLAPDQPEWSSRGDLAFICDVAGTYPYNVRGICVLSNGALSKLEIDGVPNRSPSSAGIANVLNLKWSPDGQTIVFAGQFLNSHGVQHSEVFRVNKDGTGLVQITQTPDACPGGNQLPGGPSTTMTYRYVTPSPDGKSIVAFGSKYVALTSIQNGNTYCYTQFQASGLWSMNSNGGPPMLLVASNTFAPDWQPIPQSLTFNILDGHENPLKGLKVELRRTDETLIDDQPINTVGGTYVFEDAVAPGDYIVRTTLVDRCVSPCEPAFDIRYAPNAPGLLDLPVWLEWSITVSSLPTPPYTLNFDGADPLFLGDDIPADAADRLDDMANICFRVRQYVDWVKTRLTSDTGPTAHFYTFAISDPDDGMPVDPSVAYYNALTSKIVFGVAESAYENRDNIGVTNGPENDEWHEFTHHLYHTWIHDVACRGDVDHRGYNDPDTCLSMAEGFAEFLPTLAGQDIFGPLFHVNPNSGDIELSNSFYDSMWDLQWPTKAWGYLEGGDSAEELAIAALFWDLVARSGNTEIAGVIGANGLPHVVTYTNTVGSTPISQLWSQLTSTHPGTVFELRSSFGNPPLTIDLDGDGVPDVAPIDIPFLMHGFYPVDTDQTLTASHTINFYDVGYAQRINGSAFRNGAVGGTAHHVYNAAGMETGKFIPRLKIEPGPHSNIGLNVLDAFGRPLSGAAVFLTISYPGGQTRVLRQLGSGSGALVHLELPAYFDYLLPADAPLPACDPAHDVQVNVTLSVEKDGQASTETPSFNNCTYLHAVAAATGPAALSFTVTVPVTGGGDTIPPTTTAALSPQPNVAGWNNSNVTVTLNSMDNPGGSGVKQITYSASGAQSLASTTVNVSSVPIVISTEGTTTVFFFATDNAGNVENSQQVVVMLDKTSPSIICDAADGVWHAADVSIPCTASDAGSGLANSSDANFTLSTAVPVGTETAGAPTGTHSVCDVAGNCANAGPIGGNMVDKKPPAISITIPIKTTYLLNQAINAHYACTDGGSGVATCTGTVANGSGIDTSSVGSKTFTVNATDKVGNVSPPQAVTYSVSFNLAGRGTPSGLAPARIDLTWTGIPNVASYNVFRGVTSGGPYLLIGNATVPAYSDTSGLTNGNTYYYVLQPIDGTGTEVCQSNQAAITIPNGR